MHVMTEQQLPRIGDTIDLGVWDERTNANATGTVVALMGLQQRGVWSALIVVDQGRAWELGRYLSGWTFRSEAYAPDMHSHDTRAEAMEHLPAWWRTVADGLPEDHRTP
jgi:hypothetical protein